ncbi:hypothetical protein [Chryseobacterium camelliae]|uniref:hypothetical protein n=1 Tax=Chryseobacterium camelliae TaxID=1265445 RepID=UPI0028633429|nr:hypothetical protein [Chryseobacterium camelliae]MDR6516746.1 hypothetical protein [Chryseobacterium camelliae]
MKTFLLILIFGLISQTSRAQVTAAAALIALDEIDAKITGQLQTIDNLATNAIGNTGNMVLSVSARLRKDINETIGNTDQVLRENQLLLYNQLLNMSSDFSKVVEGRMREADMITTKLTETIDNFIVVKKEPRIYRYDTQTFIKQYTGSYLFKVKGKNFDQSDQVFITINNKQIKPVQSAYDEVVFRIDSSDIVLTSPQDHYADARINFLWKKGLFRKQMHTKIPFLIPVIPLNIGKVTVFYDQALPERKYAEPISYSCSCRTGGPGMSGGRKHSTTAFNIIPTGGRLFDPNSIEVASWTQRHGGGYNFDHKTEQQIRGYINCSSESRPFGAGGSSSLTFRYKEYETIYPVHKKQTDVKAITSINPIIFDLPESVDNKRPSISYAVVKTYDQKEFILTPSNPNKFFELRMNPVTDDVIINWKN